MDRNQIDPKYKWDLTKIYATEDDFKADYDEAAAIIKRFPSHEKEMCKNAAGLLAVLNDEAKLDYVISKLWVYAHLAFDTDNSNNLAQARMGRVRSLAISASSAILIRTSVAFTSDAAPRSSLFTNSSSFKLFELSGATRRKFKTFK